MTVETKIGKITGTPEVICRIGLAFNAEEWKCQTEGYYNSAEEARTVASQIYNALDAINYFDIPEI